MINTLTESNIREEIIYMAYNFKLQSIIFGESQDSNSSSWSHFIHSQEQKENKYIPACLPSASILLFSGVQKQSLDLPTSIKNQGIPPELYLPANQIWTIPHWVPFPGSSRCIELKPTSTNIHSSIPHY